MAENSRMSKLSEKDDECIFSWKLFTGWDYMIGNAETALNRVASIVMSFKEALLEEAEKKREAQSWKMVARRMLIHTIVVGLLGLSAYVVVEVVNRSKYTDANSSVWRRNETTVVVTVMTNFFPILFEILGYFEQNHPRKQLRIQLARIMMLNLINLYALIFALFDKIFDMSDDLEKFQNLTIFEADNTTLKCAQTCEVLPHNISSASLVILVSTAVLSAFPRLASALTIDLMQPEGNGTEELDVSNLLYNNQFNESNFEFENYTELSTNGTTRSKSLEENILDFKNAFQDYLSYILSSFYIDPNKENSTNFTEDVFTTEVYMSTSMETATEDTYSYFLSTVVPALRPHATDLDEKTATDLHKNISNAVSTFVSESKSNCTESCQVEVMTYSICNSSMTETTSYASKSCLRNLCWETMFGQEIVKLTVLDLVYTIGSTLMVDFARGIFVRVMNNCWCWDLEKKFPNYGDFKVAENILHLVNNQGMVWMGMFFSPGLVLINVFKLYIILYLRSWAVLTCNVPHEIIFRASRSNNFYFALLLMMLFLCVLPVGFAIVWQRPSWHCGPFSDYKLIFHIFTKTLRNALPKYFHGTLDYIASPGIVIPLLVLLILIIYYLVSLTNSLREANNDLKIQLRRERTEERRKMFQIADRRRRAGSEGSGELANTPFGKWRKLFQTLPSGKSLDDTPKGESDEVVAPPKEVKVENIKKDFLSKLLKKALRKPSVTSEEESPPGQDDGTDTEQHDSLPEDLVSLKESRPQASKAKPAISAFRRSIAAFSQKQTSKPILENASKESVESSDTKHVKINENVPVTIHSTLPKRKDTFDLKRNQERRQRRLNQSSSRSSSSKDLREDSLTSNWSDNIPAITITKTESAENILNGSKGAETSKDTDKSKEAPVSDKQNTTKGESSKGKSKESEANRKLKSKVDGRSSKNEDTLDLEKSKQDTRRERSPSIRSFKDILGDKFRSDKLADKLADKLGKGEHTKPDVKRDERSPGIRSFRDALGDRFKHHEKSVDKKPVDKKPVDKKPVDKKPEERRSEKKEEKIAEFNISVKPKLEGKFKEERRKFIGKPRDLERRPSKSRILNMEQTLEPIASSNDNLDSDTQEDFPKVRHVLMKQLSETGPDEMPIDLIQGTMGLPTTSRSLERSKKFILRKQLSEVGSDDNDEPTVRSLFPAKSDDSKKSTNGESVKTTDTKTETDTTRTESDTIKTESSTEYKDDIFSNDTIE